MNSHIFLDHNSSTSLDPIVYKTLLQELEIEKGNPSSIHFYGRECKKKLEHSREVIAGYLKVKPGEIIFTSGGTEGANLLLQGFFNQVPQGHVITSDAEHSCVYNIMKLMEKKGRDITFLSAGQWGAVQAQELLKAIRPDTCLIVLMAVNNETGVKTGINEIASIAEQRGIPLIVDGVALLGKEAFDIPQGVSAMFFSGHKLHAPKGVGAVFCRSSLKLAPYMIGGAQENNRRAGTENLPGIVAFAKAIELFSENQHAYTERMRFLRDRLEASLKRDLKDISILGEGPRVVNISNISFDGVDGESLLIGLDNEGISVSHGSACTSGAIEPSRILLNMGVPLRKARSAIRFSVSRQTSEEEIDRCVAIVVKLVRKLRR